MILVKIILDLVILETIGISVIIRWPQLKKPNSLKEGQSVISDFELLTEIGCDLSQHFRGIFIDDQIKTKSTHLLTKAIDNSFSILKLIPESKYSKEKEHHFDISSIFYLFAGT